MRPSETDLFTEEQAMPAMSFGEHIEELRVRLILALMGLFVGVAITFIPVPVPGFGWFYLGQWVMKQMQDPAQVALDQFYEEQAERRAKEANAEHAQTEPFEVQYDAGQFASELRKIFPELEVPPAEQLEGQTITLKNIYTKADWIKTVTLTADRKSALVVLGPLEGFMIFFMVCIVTGLVIASPWVFYQIWAFIAAGLYKHERRYVLRFLPYSIGLFLAGVLLCFLYVLPYTLKFLLDFNVWLGIEPMLRIADWISFATILPLVFGLCFQTPLIMLILERIGIFSAEVYRANRRYAILIMCIAAAVITPTGDPITMLLLAIPMYALYELGIRLIPDRPSHSETDVPAAVG